MRMKMVFQKYISNTRNVASSKRASSKVFTAKKDVIETDSVQTNSNYQMPTVCTDANIKRKGNITNSEKCDQLGSRPVSFCGKVALHLPFGEGAKRSNDINSQMEKFSKEILQMKEANPSTFDDWYHRKSGSIVLSVCQWRDESKTTSDNEDNNQFVYTRGINVEVSLITGSICAERVAIAQAHTLHPDLKGYKNLTAVAVLEISTNADDSTGKNPLFPCAVCQIWLEKLASPDIRVIGYQNTELTSFFEVYRPWPT